MHLAKHPLIAVAEDFFEYILQHKSSIISLFAPVRIMPESRTT
ncbi:MAG: hypothetical protein WBM41_12020 [Arenicellales bacterium]